MIALALVATRAARASDIATPTLPSASPAAAVDAATEAVHDHTPRHGGIVAMSGTRHVEAVLRSDGVLRVHPSDLHRAPLALAGAGSKASVNGASGRASHPLTVHGDALETRIPPPSGS